jgi:tRNA-Thr(GGU) m(6)t(6)A37 methyltransferase TsaA
VQNKIVLSDKDRGRYDATPFFGNWRISLPHKNQEASDVKIISYTPIGVIRSPFKEISGTPIQPMGAEGISGQVEIDGKYADGLKDLDGFSHIILFYHFHMGEGYSLEVKPFLDDRYHGVFATRAPKRPNPIGISTVKLIRVDGSVLYIQDVDVVDGTPLLDIKPYVPQIDSRETDRIGWMSGRAWRAKETRADERFK